jgi:hypothetical protein
MTAELHERVHGDAVLLSTSHDQSRGELVAELGGEDQAALLIELGREGAEEHLHPPSVAATRDPNPISSQLAPLYPTPPHPWPPERRNHPMSGASLQVNKVEEGGGIFGARRGATASERAAAGPQACRSPTALPHQRRSATPRSAPRGCGARGGGRGMIPVERCGGRPGSGVGSGVGGRRSVPGPLGTRRSPGSWSRGFVGSQVRAGGGAGQSEGECRPGTRRARRPGAVRGAGPPPRASPSAPPSCA